MQRLSRNRVVAAIWVAVVCLAGVVAQVHSVLGWSVVAALAVGPPLVLLRPRRGPRQSMSESIQEALR